MAKSPQWINEQEASQKIGYKPEVLRKKVKAGILKINYSTITGRKYFYNEHDITKVLTAHSNILK